MTYLLGHKISTVYPEARLSHDLRWVAVVDFYKSVRHIYPRVKPRRLTVYDFYGVDHILKDPWPPILAWELKISVYI